jgi:hypothetical protein
MPSQDALSMVSSNYAMQRSALDVTPLARTASGSHRLDSASSAPTARRRWSRTVGRGSIQWR